MERIIERREDCGGKGRIIKKGRVKYNGGGGEKMGERGEILRELEAGD